LPRRSCAAPRDDRVAGQRVDRVDLSGLAMTMRTLRLSKIGLSIAGDLDGRAADLVFRSERTADLARGPGARRGEVPARPSRYRRSGAIALCAGAGRGRGHRLRQTPRRTAPPRSPRCAGAGSSMSPTRDCRRPQRRRQDRPWRSPHLRGCRHEDPPRDVQRDRTRRSLRTAWSAAPPGVRLDRMSLGIACTHVLLIPMVWVTGFDTGVVFLRRADFEAIGGLRREHPVGRGRAAHGRDVEARPLARAEARAPASGQGDRLGAEVSTSTATGTTLRLVARAIPWLFGNRGPADRIADRYWYGDRRR